MDEADIRIIRAMGVRPYATRPRDPEASRPAHIAKRLGMSVNTVKTRIRKMEATGVIAGYTLMPNLRHLGLSGAAYYFAPPAGELKERAIEEVPQVDGILELHDFMGGGLCVDFAYQDEAAREEVLARVSGSTQDLEPERFYDRATPPVERELTHLDWRILRALRQDVHRPLEEVGEELGVTGRTVRSRHARMAKEGVFFCSPILDPTQAEGLIFFELLVFMEDGAFSTVSREALTAVDRDQVFTYVPASPELGHLGILLFARSTAQVERLRQQVGAIRGVERAEAWLFRGLYDHSHWIDDMIDTRIAELGPAPL